MNEMSLNAEGALQPDPAGPMGRTTTSVLAVERILRDFLVRQGANLDGDLASDRDLLEEGVIDSLLILELIDFIEERFSVHVPVDDITPTNFQTLRSISILVATRFPSHDERR